MRNLARGHIGAVAEAAHTTATPWEFWHGLHFREAFPMITHWGFPSVWTGRVKVVSPETEPLADGSVWGWMTFDVIDEPRRPWAILDTNPVGIEPPLPPNEEQMGGEIGPINYFGVPYANCWAWFWVVSAFSAGRRLLAGGPSWTSWWLGPVGALAVGLAVVLAINQLIIALILQGLYVPAVALLLGGALILVLALRPRLFPGGDTWRSLVAELGFHLYFLIAGLLTGVMLQPPALLAVSLVMLGLTLALHRRDLAALRVVRSAAPHP